MQCRTEASNINQHHAKSTNIWQHPPTSSNIQQNRATLQSPNKGHWAPGSRANDPKQVLRSNIFVTQKLHSILGVAALVGRLTEQSQVSKELGGPLGWAQWVGPTWSLRNARLIGPRRMGLALWAGPNSGAHWAGPNGPAHSPAQCQKVPKQFTRKLFMEAQSDTAWLIGALAAQIHHPMLFRIFRRWRRSHWLHRFTALWIRL